MVSLVCEKTCVTLVEHCKQFRDPRSWNVSVMHEQEVNSDLTGLSHVLLLCRSVHLWHDDPVILRGGLSLVLGTGTTHYIHNACCWFSCQLTTESDHCSSERSSTPDTVDVDHCWYMYSTTDQSPVVTNYNTCCYQWSGICTIGHTTWSVLRLIKINLCHASWWSCWIKYWMLVRRRNSCMKMKMT